MSNYDGLTRNTWPGTWSSNGTHPIVLDTELRGSLQYVGSKLTDITGQRLQEGMLAYLKTGYNYIGTTGSTGSNSRQGDTYYKYNSLTGEVRNQFTGQLPNGEANWSIISLEGGYTGDTGPTGPGGGGGYILLQGVVGPPGPMGQQGPQGIPGINGNHGIRGPCGKNGMNGMNGVDGRDGKDGKDGKDGIDGTQIFLISTLEPTNYSITNEIYKQYNKYPRKNDIVINSATQILSIYV